MPIPSVSASLTCMLTCASYVASPGSPDLTLPCLHFPLRSYQPSPGVPSLPPALTFPLLSLTLTFPPYLPFPFFHLPLPYVTFISTSPHLVFHYPHRNLPQLSFISTHLLTLTLPSPVLPPPPLFLPLAFTLRFLPDPSLLPPLTCPSLIPTCTYLSFP